MKRILLLLTIIIGSFAAKAQQSSFLPQNLGEAVNSYYSEVNPIMSPDGTTLYFVRLNHPENKYGEENSQDIWYTTMNEDGSWNEAKRLPDNVNIGRYNSILSLSEDGKTALINGIYDKNGTIWKKRGLSLIRKNNDEWTTPEPLDIMGFSKMNSGSMTNAYLSRDERMLVLCFSKSINSKKQDIYFSFRKGDSYTRPKKIKALSSRAVETAPFLNAENNVIYFASNRRGKYNYDIYRSEMMAGDWKRWTTPVLLNDTINTFKYESYYKTNLSGSTAFYSSANESLGNADIYKIKLFEEKPFVVVRGKVLNYKTKEVLEKGQDFAILANGTPIDSLVIDHETSTYTATMPLGNSYSLTANVDKFKPRNKIIDVSEIEEYTEMYADLYVEPFDYVLVKGNLRVKSTNALIPTTSNPRLIINGEVPDSLYVDYDAGIYEVKLPYGHTYTMVVNTNEFDPIPDVLNLENVNEYKEINRDLFVDKEKTAVVTGRIYDKNTDKPFPSDVPLTIKLNDANATKVTIDSLTREYSVEVSLGAIHTLSADAEDYYSVTEVINLAGETEKIKVLKDLYLVPLEIGQSVRLNNIFFETAKATLKEESFPELQRVVKFLEDNPKIRIEIGGHTDNVGKKAYNLKLSEQRAESVAQYLLLHGIPEAAITFKGYGMSMPIADNDTETGRQINRRVEFTIIGK